MAVDEAALRAFEHAAWQKAPPHYADGFGRAAACFVPALLDAAGVGQGTRLLDLCCGLGAAAAAGVARGALVEAADFSAAMLAAARRLVPGAGFVEADAERLPQPDRYFTAVVANFGIHHVPAPPRAMAEAARVLAQGGRMAFTVWAEPARNQAWRLLLDAVRRHGTAIAPSVPPPQGGLNTPQAAAALLSGAGFTSVRAEIVEARWEVADVAELVGAFASGTARMAAVIGAQGPASRTAILAYMAEHARGFAVPSGLSVPIAAVVASGILAG